jgi:hypothetical protein
MQNMIMAIVYLYILCGVYSSLDNMCIVLLFIYFVN